MTDEIAESLGIAYTFTLGYTRFFFRIEERRRLAVVRRSKKNLVLPRALKKSTASCCGYVFGDDIAEFVALVRR